MTLNDKYKQYSKEELINELETLKRKKYGLVWDKKNSQETLDAFVNWENVPESFTPKQFPVLKEVKNKEIETDKTKPVNLLIEGDNYHSLAVLNFTHQNKVDVIYIDPPYNIGNNDFTYNDKFVDKEDSFRHSKWLSFMEKRLRLAQKLLKNTGVIFISIDDNEQAQLKLLCDEVFEEKNYIATLIWNKKNVVQNDARYFSVNHEYVLCYARNIENVVFNLLPRTEELNARYSNPDNDPRGEWTSVALQAKSGRENNIYEMTFSNGVKWKPVAGTFPRLNKESLLRAYNEGRLWFGKMGKNVPRLKKYLLEVKQGVVSNSILLPSEVGSTQLAKETLKKILNKNIFETPKPVDLIKRFIRLNSDKNGLVLDFFAGSGTTAQAVLSLNKEDKGIRKFILCTNNENNICTNVCYPRVEKVIEGYKNSKDENVVGLGGNLKYFKTDFVDSDSTDKNKRDLVNKSAEMICIKEDIFDIVIDRDLDFKIYQKGKKFLGIIFDIDAVADFKKEAEQYKGKFVVYCFSYTEATPEKEFEGLKNKYILKPIPALILKVYSNIFEHKTRKK